MERVRSHGLASSSCSSSSDLGRRSVAGLARTATLTPVPSRRQQQQQQHQEHHHTPAAGRDSASLSPSGAPNPRLSGPIRDLSRFRRAWPAVSIKLEEAEPSTSATSTQVPEENIITEFIAETLLPTRHGLFRLRGYKHSADGGVTFTEPTATIAGQVEGREDVPVRIHDACFTSEVLGSLKCDCAEQLTLALQMIQKNQLGMVIYLQQEGRGIGLANKIAAYSLQEQGLDTVDANRALGLPDDCREYSSVRNILSNLGIKSVQLITNNPRKISELKALGIKVTGRIPCLVEAGEFNQGYLEAKRDRMDHMIGEWCYWNHDGEPTQPSSTAHTAGGMGLPQGLTRTPDGRVMISMDSVDDAPALPRVAVDGSSSS